MKKIYRIGKLKTLDIFVKAEYARKESGSGKWTLTMAGVIGPRPDGNASGSAGQIDMEFQHRLSEDNDTRYADRLIKPEEISFAPGWDKEKWYDLLEIWSRWHLNDLHAECEHQRALGWTYETHQGQKCPTCGYLIGSEWKYEDVPDEVIKKLTAFPDADRAPAWV